jgi:putative heme iron utilization protein
MQETANFSAKDFAKKLLREGRSGALASLMRGSKDPYCSLVNVATTADGSPVLYISKMAIHTRNLIDDPRVSLMLDERAPGDPLEGGRVMLMGTAVATDDADVQRRYFDRQPEAKQFAQFHDFGFYKIELKGARLVAGFGRIVNLKQEDLLTKVADAAKVVAGEADILTHLNEDHAHTCRLYATKLLGAADGEWRFAGCDPEGLELQLGHKALRLTFPQRVRTPGAMRKMLIKLAGEARAK